MFQFIETPIYLLDVLPQRIQIDGLSFRFDYSRYLFSQLLSIRLGHKNDDVFLSEPGAVATGFSLAYFDRLLSEVRNPPLFFLWQQIDIIDDPDYCRIYRRSGLSSGCGRS